MCASDSVWRIAVAKKRKLLAARGISSARASESGLPVSIDSARASFSRSRSIKSAMRRRIRDRSVADVRDLRICFSRCWLDIVEIFAADRVNELAVDEVLNFLSRLCHVERSRAILYAS